MTPTRVGTSWYRAPEICLGEPFCYGLSSDLWSLGCIIAELFLTPKWSELCRDALVGTLFQEDVRHLMATPGQGGGDDDNQIHIIRHVRLLGTRDCPIAMREWFRKHNIHLIDFPPVLPHILDVANVPKVVQDVVLGLLRFDPATRLSADDVVKLLTFPTNQTTATTTTAAAAAAKTISHKRVVKKKK
eukprot:PhM_4_TR9192/c0_g2_i1/m.16043